jgi:hypothetical protein
VPRRQLQLGEVGEAILKRVERLGGLWESGLFLSTRSVSPVCLGARRGGLPRGC